MFGSDPNVVFVSDPVTNTDSIGVEYSYVHTKKYLYVYMIYIYIIEFVCSPRLFE